MTFDQVLNFDIKAYLYDKSITKINGNRMTGKSGEAVCKLAFDLSLEQDIFTVMLTILAV